MFNTTVSGFRPVGGAVTYDGAISVSGGNLACEANGRPVCLFLDRDDPSVVFASGEPDISSEFRMVCLIPAGLEDALYAGAYGDAAANPSSSSSLFPLTPELRRFTLAVGLRNGADLQKAIAETGDEDFGNVVRI